MNYSKYLLIEKIGECSIDTIKFELENKKFKDQLALQGAIKDDFDGSLYKKLYGDPTNGDPYKQRPDEKNFNISLYGNMPYTNSIIKKYEMFRTRAIALKQNRAYSIHQDLTPRIHIPLETNDNCLFILNDVVYRLPADGSIYFVDTTLPHTALNGNRNVFTRTHIVGCINC